MPDGIENVDADSWQRLAAMLLKQAPAHCPGMPPDWIQDAVQEDLLTMLVAAEDGECIDRPVAFGIVLLRRHYVDWIRRRQRRLAHGGESGDDATSDPGDPVDWVARLRREGFEPTAKWSQILDRIASGTTSSGGLARALDCDESTIRENRRRLRSWLQSTVLPALQAT